MPERKLTADELTTLRHWFTTGAVDQYPSPGDFKQTLLASASNLLFAEYDRQSARNAALEASLRALLDAHSPAMAGTWPVTYACACPVCIQARALLAVA